MRYAVGMTPGLTLNTANAHTWAAVVSGTVWKRHTLAPDDALTAEYTRGPLILWAKTPGAGEVVQADGPVLSALEGRIDQLNTAQVFERFKWGRDKRRFFKKMNSRLHFTFEFPKETIGFLPESTCFIYSRQKFGSRKRSILKFTDIETRQALDILVSTLDYDDFRTSEELITRMKSGESWRDLRFILLEFAKATKAQRATTLLLKDYEKNIKRTRKRLKSLYLQRVAFLVLTKKIQAAAFRAHLTRRVKPAPRRHRIRRPLYARPRPPSAPLAPPVF